MNKLKLRLDFPGDLFYCTAFGLITFTLLAYTLSWLKIPIAVVLILLVFDYFVLKEKSWYPEKLKRDHTFPVILVILMSLVFTTPMITRGIWGESINYSRDDLWHLALINELKSQFPPQIPGFAGVSLKGYHFFYNFILAQISNIFSINPISLHFHFFPLLVSVLWGLGVYSLMFIWRKDIFVSLLAVFLTMFAGSFAFMLLLTGHGGFNFDSSLGIQQLARSLYNPPFSLSILLIIFSLISIHQFIFKKNNRWLIPLALAAGIIAMIKVYAAMVLFAGLCLLGFKELVKRNFYIVYSGCAALGIFLFTSWTFIVGTGSLIFYPLWGPHEMLRNFPWYGYDERIYTYSKLGVIRGVLGTELYGITIFLFGNLGTRVIGLLVLIWVLVRKKLKTSFFSIVFCTMTLTSIIVPLLFIQTGKVFEIIQMAWYFLFLISLLSATGIAIMFRFNFKYSNIVKVFLFFLFIVFTIPSAVESYIGYFKNLKLKENLEDPYFQTVFFLKESGGYNQVILEVPKENVSANRFELRSWYDSSSNPSLTAFANKRSFLSNGFIDFPGVNVESRLIVYEDFLNLAMMPPEILKEGDQTKLISLLRDNGILFIYSPYPVLSLETMDGIQKIYQNRSNAVYKIL